MTDTGMSEAVTRFIAQHIHSVYQLEVLLLLYRTSARGWTAAQVAAELRTNLSFAGSTLDDLVGRGLLVRAEPNDPGEVTYTFRPAGAELASVVADLAKAYAERHLAVISLIFSKPPEQPDTMQAFADAFRIRGKDRS